MTKRLRMPEWDDLKPLNFSNMAVTENYLHPKVRKMPITFLMTLRQMIWAYDAVGEM